MNSTNKRVDELLENAKSSIENAQNIAGIKMLISQFGYGESRLQGLLELRSEADGKYLVQKQKSSLRLQTSSLYAEKLKEERTRYLDCKKFAKMAFSDASDRSYYELLGFVGGKTKQRLGFATQAKHFYQNALGQQKILDKLAYFLITPEKLQEGLTGIEELERIKAEKVAVSGEMQLATAERNNACQKLNRAFANFIKTSKVGLRDVPQLQEMLGITDRNTPIRKRTAEDQETQNNSTVLKMVKDSSVTSNVPQKKEPKNAEDQDTQIDTTVLKMVKDSSVTSNVPQKKEPKNAEDQETQNDTTVLKMVKDSSVTAPAPKTKEPEKDIEMTESGE
ncbi:MAG: hypothetical protein ACM3SY_17515 [Candidatus Omnitrophota bacterium]